MHWNIVSHALMKKSVHFFPLLNFLKWICCLFTWLWNYTWAFLLFWFGDRPIQSLSNPSLLQTIPIALFCISWYIWCVIEKRARLPCHLTLFQLFSLLLLYYYCWSLASPASLSKVKYLLLIIKISTSLGCFSSV